MYIILSLYFVTHFNPSLVDSEEDKDRKDDPKEMEQEEVFSRQEPSTSGQNAEVAHSQGE